MGISTRAKGSRGSRWRRGCLLGPRRHGLADVPPDHLPEALPGPGPAADAGAPREVVGEGEDSEPRGDEQRAGEEVGDAPGDGDGEPMADGIWGREEERRDWGGREGVREGREGERRLAAVCGWRVEQIRFGLFLFCPFLFLIIIEHMNIQIYNAF